MSYIVRTRLKLRDENEIMDIQFMLSNRKYIF